MIISICDNNQWREIGIPIHFITSKVCKNLLAAIPNIVLMHAVYQPSEPWMHSRQETSSIDEGLEKCIELVPETGDCTNSPCRFSILLSNPTPSSTAHFTCIVSTFTSWWFPLPVLSLFVSSPSYIQIQFCTFWLSNFCSCSSVSFTHPTHLLPNDPFSHFPCPLIQLPLAALSLNIQETLSTFYQPICPFVLHKWLLIHPFMFLMPFPITYRSSSFTHFFTSLSTTHTYPIVSPFTFHIVY